MRGGVKVSKKFKLFFLMVLIFSEYSFAESSDIWSHFEAGDYEKVISVADEINLDKVDSHKLNIIGSSFYRLNRNFEATYYFFLGLKKDPFNRKLLHNLKLSSGKRIDLASDKIYQNFFVLSCFLLLIVLLAFIFKPGLRRKKSLLFLYSMSLGIICLIKYDSKDLNNYLLIKKEKSLKAGIDPKAFVFEKLEQGSILYINQRVSDHLQVEGVFNQKVGWIKK